MKQEEDSLKQEDSFREIFKVKTGIKAGDNWDAWGQGVGQQMANQGQQIGEDWARRGMEIGRQFSGGWW